MLSNMNAKDFDRLTKHAEWGEWARDDSDRWEHVDKPYDTEPSYSWPHAYWVGDDWFKVMLCREWLSFHHFDYEVIYDVTQHLNGEFLGYVILTHYESGDV